MKFAIYTALLSAFLATSVAAQVRNNPYSPSPTGQAANRGIETVKRIPTLQLVESRPDVSNQPRAIAHVERPAVKVVESPPRPATETYKVGVGDVLFINLKNTRHGSGYYTVGENGAIDYPLAGENIIVADKTVESIAGALAQGIKLFANAQVEVNVREYASHKIRVSGAVERPGEKSLQREAVPLYVIRAEALTSTGATQALVVRAPTLKAETYDLRAPGSDQVLIYPGNSVEFLITKPEEFYYLSGDSAAIGQKNMTPGLTLSQTIAAAGSKGKPKKATVRRKNSDGTLSVTDFNLKAIKEGKTADPQVVAGDVIEIKN